MAQRAIEVARARLASSTTSPGAPTLGLRGGLGKTLLIAFLLLAIAPLSLLAFLTYNQIQRDTGRALVTSLGTVAALKEAHLVDRIQSYERGMALLVDELDRTASNPATSQQDKAPTQALFAQLAEVQVSDRTLVSLALVDPSTGDILAATDRAHVSAEILQPVVTGEQRMILIPNKTEDSTPLVALGRTWAGQRLIGLFDGRSLLEIIADADSQEEEIVTRLVTSDGLIVSAHGIGHLPVSGQDAAAGDVSPALQGQSGSGAYENLEGTLVFGAYRWNPDFHFTLLAEKSQIEALAAGNNMTAMVVAVTLAVALITAAIAAVVTRRVTTPIVQLTEKAAWMARGDLNQQVTINRQDEIGVLARAFNRMAEELRALYNQLEAKVSERTQQLEEANEHTQYYVMQLATSAEVARVASSIRDLDEMLATVVDLIARAFELEHVSIYFVDDSEELATWQVGSNSPDLLAQQVQVGGPTLVGQIAQDGTRRAVQRDPASEPNAAGAVCELAMPLRVRGCVLGVLDLHSSRANEFGESDQLVYQSLADQISIAIENARAYALERETVVRLQELDQIQSEFLTNMSHALRTPLNSIIGFSRVVLKELDGPLTEMQRDDVETVYQSGRQLLGLINDMLDLSQLELGTAPFSATEVDLTEIIEGVMATARALARGKPVQLYDEIAADVPTLYTDGQRVRQVILALLANAVKFSDEGSIHLRVTPENGHVTISVSDTDPGTTIPHTERSKFFSDTRYYKAGSDQDTSGIGLAVSRRVVERLGGEIWVESTKGVGSTFTFTLPTRPIEQDSPGQDDVPIDAEESGNFVENGAENDVGEA